MHGDSRIVRFHWSDIHVFDRTASGTHTHRCPEHRMSITVVAGIMHVKRFHSIREYELVFRQDW